MSLGVSKITRKFIRKFPIKNKILKDCIYPIGKMDSLSFKASLIFVCLISLQVYYFVEFSLKHLFYFGDYFVSGKIMWFINIANFIIYFIFICSIINIFLKRARTKGSPPILAIISALIFIVSMFALTKIADTSPYSQYSINIITEDWSYLFYIIALIAGAISVWVLLLSKNEPTLKQTKKNYTPKHYLVKISIPILVFIGIAISLLYCAAFTKWSYFGGFRGSDLSVIIFYILLLLLVISFIVGGIYTIRMLFKRATDAKIPRKYPFYMLISQLILSIFFYLFSFELLSFGVFPSDMFFCSISLFGIGYLIIGILPTKKIKDK